MLVSVGSTNTRNIVRLSTDGKQINLALRFLCIAGRLQWSINHEVNEIQSEYFEFVVLNNIFMKSDQNFFLPELTNVRIKFLYVQVTLSSGGVTTGIARISPIRVIHRCRFATCRDADY